jgi:hypothetical protein
MSTRFSPSEIRLPSGRWTALVAERLPSLDSQEKAWLYAWASCDLALPPKNDYERSLMRYSHHLGWFDAQEKKTGGA